MALYRSLDYQVNWPFGSGEEVQIRFPRWRPWHHHGFLIGTILALFFFLQVTLMLPTTFGSRPFGSGEAKNRLL